MKKNRLGAEPPLSPLKHDAKCVFVIIIITIAVCGRFATDYYYYYYYHRIGEQNVSLTTRYEKLIKLAGSRLLENVEQCTYVCQK